MQAGLQPLVRRKISVREIDVKRGALAMGGKGSLWIWSKSGALGRQLYRHLEVSLSLYRLGACGVCEKQRFDLGRSGGARKGFVNIGQPCAGLVFWERPSEEITLRHIASQRCDNPGLILGFDPFDHEFFAKALCE